MVLEVIHQTGQQVDLRQIEQSVVHIDPAENQVEKIHRVSTLLPSVVQLAMLVRVFERNLLRLEELETVATEEDVPEPVHLDSAVQWSAVRSGWGPP